MSVSRAARRRRFWIAVAAGAAIVLSAPFAQQAFSAIDRRWPAHSETIVISATAVPAAASLLVALWRIREHRWVRYLLVTSGVGLGAAYIYLADPIFTETFHFIEYGVLAALFYRVWYPRGDASTLVLPLLASAIVGSADEWFQWLIPIRAGEARDVGINVLAAVCGVLFATGFAPPARPAQLQMGSGALVGRWAAAAVLAFAGFFYVVHIGHDVMDPEIGSFRSRFTASELARAARDRATRWRERPPIEQRRIAREDHYLTEALWHVRRRNEAWEAGDAAAAWRENRILEKFYAPVLDTPTYAGAGGHRWPAVQRDEAGRRGGAHAVPFASDEFAYPLYVLPGVF